MEYNSTPAFAEFSQFLHDDLAISDEELSIALQNRKCASDPLPMILWQYGLISLEQLQGIFDWLDARL
ncbi:MAG: DUF2949 domain-containing protein [Spirulina sp.]